MGLTTCKCEDPTPGFIDSDNKVMHCDFCHGVVDLNEIKLEDLK